MDVLCRLGCHIFINVPTSDVASQTPVDVQEAELNIISRRIGQEQMH